MGSCPSSGELAGAPKEEQGSADRLLLRPTLRAQRPKAAGLATQASFLLIRMGNQPAASSGFRILQVQLSLPICTLRPSVVDLSPSLEPLPFLVEVCIFKTPVLILLPVL